MNHFFSLVRHFSHAFHFPLWLFDCGFSIFTVTALPSSFFLRLSIFHCGFSIFTVVALASWLFSGFWYCIHFCQILTLFWCLSHCLFFIFNLVWHVWWVVNEFWWFVLVWHVLVCSHLYEWIRFCYGIWLFASQQDKSLDLSWFYH